MNHPQRPCQLQACFDRGLFIANKVQVPILNKHTVKRLGAAEDADSGVNCDGCVEGWNTVCAWWTPAGD